MTLASGSATTTEQCSACGRRPAAGRMRGVPARDWWRRGTEAADLSLNTCRQESRTEARGATGHGRPTSTAPFAAGPGIRGPQ